MVINIRLGNRTTAQTDDPLGRSWYGYDPAVTPEQLWSNNRGDWNLDANRIDGQHWAALNYQGQIVLVVELGSTGFEWVTIPSKRPKKALIGRVLTKGDPAHDALIGTHIEYPPGSRNPILYGDDPEIVEVSPNDALGELTLQAAGSGNPKGFGHEESPRSRDTGVEHGLLL
ncbi:hypothetical protein FQP90_08880 [Paenarthrobacter nitroguajacolicus]|uniref:Uncharacterized protein n=1 Tax=Paenarthrobacter nitroguajacolicus TaxID=211146 RepID=A0A558H4S0_PAENT|nr:hypothetical protein [Paenarthrobacter nitroguajacolicus]TVU64091.1 hypothetical protein FQP90_08880 [Paenarthrobacter nitroguajacolicus]